MRNLLIVLPLLLFAGCGSTPVTAPTQRQPVEVWSAPTAFPESWYGTWKGEIHIEPYEGEEQRLPMTLIVGPKEDGRWQFSIQYGSQATRPYELVAVKPKLGRYQIDEMNSIVLPAWFTEGELVSIFSLQGQILITRYRLVGDEIRFSVLVTRTVPNRKTGGLDQIPSVGAHLPLTYQRARLKRVK